MLNSNPWLINDDDYEDCDEVNITRQSYIDAEDSICYEDFQEEDDQFDEQSIHDQSEIDGELFYEFKEFYNEKTYVDFPDIKLFQRQIDGLAPIPKDFQFNDKNQYQDIMNKLQIESYFFDLRNSIKENLKEQQKKSSQESTFAQFQRIQNFKVEKVGFKNYGLYLTIDFSQKVLKYQKQQWEILNNQLIIFKDKKSDKIFIGKAIVSQENEEKAIEDKEERVSMQKMHHINQIMIKKMLADEKFVQFKPEQCKKLLQQQNDQFKLINFHQHFDIRMNTCEGFKYFLKNIKNIEKDYILLTPNEYYLSLQKIQNSHIQFRFLDQIAFEDQTLNARKGEIIFPKYEFLENKKTNIEFYKKLIKHEIDSAFQLDKFQKQALSDALQNQNSLIQGPPGTGKTFLAAYLVNTLIRLKKQFCQKPILVVSKKNCSLDQLLMKIKGQNDQVKFLRLGFMSQEESIEQFTVEGQKGPKKILKYDKNIYKAIEKRLENVLKYIDQNEYDYEEEDRLDEILQEMNSYYSYYIKNTISCDMKYQNKLANFMKRYEVIGMTLTAYHIHFEALRQLQAEVIVIEEASEIIESDFFPILTPWLKHLIQLGDHQQLRPFQRAKILEETYNYKMSYFERLITVNKIQMITLYQQRRMRPEFANFTRLFYGDKYKDDSSVQSANFIKEISSIGMYLLPHTYPDTRMRDCSYINQYEAQFIYFLVSKLSDIYQQSQITVLSMYKSQKILIQSKLFGFREVLCYTVDEFQGNENDIIILSCVRSNIKNNCGFIKESHRVNVAFSRAKIGFFCIGNFIMYQMKVPIWRNINSLAFNQMIYGGVKQLRLYEKIHKLTTISMQKIQNRKGEQEEDTCNLCSQHSHMGNCEQYQQQWEDQVNYEYVRKQPVNSVEIIKQIQNEAIRKDVMSTIQLLKQFNQLSKSNPQFK
ncbi:hypothetical protein ABPG74_020733 [Tetrahymena malaccensis]